MYKCIIHVHVQDTCSLDLEFRDDNITSITLS